MFGATLKRWWILSLVLVFATANGISAQDTPPRLLPLARSSGRAAAALGDWTADSSVKTFGPSYSGAKQGRAMATLFFSIINYRTGEAKTWLNTSSPGPYRLCSKVNSYKINGANMGSTGEECKDTSTANDIQKSWVSNTSSCTTGVTYTYEVANFHKITNSGGTNWSINSGVSTLAYCR